MAKMVENHDATRSMARPVNPVPYQSTTRFIADFAIVTDPYSD